MTTYSFLTQAFLPKRNGVQQKFASIYNEYAEGSIRPSTEQTNN